MVTVLDEKSDAKTEAKEHDVEYTEWDGKRQEWVQVKSTWNEKEKRFVTTRKGKTKAPNTFTGPQRWDNSKKQWVPVKQTKEDADKEAAKSHRRRMRLEVADLLRDAAETWEREARREKDPDIELSMRSKALKARIMARRSERGHLCFQPRKGSGK